MSYDVIVVGAGAGGSALAHRLTADPAVQVLLVEAGPDERPSLVADPARWPQATGSPYDYGYSSTGQTAAGGRTVALPRGRILGGSTGINAMVHSRPWSDDLSGWGQGWSDADLSACFGAIERYRGPSPHRGHDGPVEVGPALQPHPLSADFVTAAVQAGHCRLPDVDQPGDVRLSDAEGAGWFDLSIDESGRVDAARAYLRSVQHRTNLTIRTDTAVSCIRFDGRRASWLELEHDGGVELLPITGELVLCAGAIETPAVLMRSGIGARADLESAGVDCLFDAPAVGRNLHDHPMIPVIWASDRPVPAGRNQLAESYLTLRSDHRAPGKTLSLAFAHIAMPHPLAAPAEYGATALVGLFSPLSRGRVTLDPTDPARPVLVDPAYLTDPEDVDALIAGVMIAREIAAQPALEHYRLTELVPGPVADAPQSLREIVRMSVGSYGHLAGTCAIGADGVVDSGLRVHGISNLRIADASVIPTLPGVAPSATVQVIGWRAAELIMNG